LGQFYFNVIGKILLCGALRLRDYLQNRNILSTNILSQTDSPVKGLLLVEKK